MNIIDSIKRMKWYEVMLWGISVLAILISFFLFKNHQYTTLIASLIGVTALIFVAKEMGEFSHVAVGYQMRFMVDALHPPENAAARLFEKRMQDLKRFKLVHQTRKYRVFILRESAPARAHAGGELERLGPLQAPILVGDPEVSRVPAAFVLDAPPVRVHHVAQVVGRGVGLGAPAVPHEPCAGTCRPQALVEAFHRVGVVPAHDAHAVVRSRLGGVLGPGALVEVVRPERARVGAPERRRHPMPGEELPLRCESALLRPDVGQDVAVPERQPARHHAVGVAVCVDLRDGPVVPLEVAVGGEASPADAVGEGLFLYSVVMFIPPPPAALTVKWTTPRLSYRLHLSSLMKSNALPLYST